MYQQSSHMRDACRHAWPYTAKLAHASCMQATTYVIACSQQRERSELLRIIRLKSFRKDMCEGAMVVELDDSDASEWQRGQMHDIAVKAAGKLPVSEKSLFHYAALRSNHTICTARCLMFKTLGNGNDPDITCAFGDPPPHAIRDACTCNSCADARVGKYILSAGSQMRAFRPMCDTRLHAREYASHAAVGFTMPRGTSPRERCSQTARATRSPLMAWTSGCSTSTSQTPARVSLISHQAFADIPHAMQIATEVVRVEPLARMRAAIMNVYTATRTRDMQS